MKYFTKTWYELMQKTNYTASLKVIEDKNYTSKDIKEIYHNKLIKELNKEIKAFNKEPSFLDIEESLKDENYNPEDWLVYNFQTNKYVTPSSKQEVIDSVNMEKQRALQDYQNRGEFDTHSFIEAFENMYSFALKNVRKNYPNWLVNEVDNRLLALDLIPNSSYKKLKKEEKENKKLFNKINKNAKKTLSKHASALDQIVNKFDFYDASVISLKAKKNNDIVLKLITEHGLGEADDTHTIITFKNASFVELDNTLKVGYNYSKNGKFTRCTYLYDELYKLRNSKIEVHMMLENFDGLKYVTIRCEGIEIN